MALREKALEQNYSAVCPTSEILRREPTVVATKQDISTRRATTTRGLVLQRGL